MALTNRLKAELNYVRLDLEHERENNEPEAFAAYCREVVLLATSMFLDATAAVRSREPAPAVAVVESCEV